MWFVGEMQPVNGDTSCRQINGDLALVAQQVGASHHKLISCLFYYYYYYYTTTTTVVVFALVSFIKHLMCCMQAFIMNASVRDNILFGSPYDFKRYPRAVEAAALLPDLAVLPDGDHTLIGSKGQLRP